MLQPGKPSNEQERLATLRSCGVLDSEPEPAFDDIARLAMQLCGVPIALVTLIDADRSWFKARIGIPGTEGPRDQAFCAHAILIPHQPMLVRDARDDPRFADHPAVIGEPWVRFYAGVPLVLDDGAAVGTLCVVDRVPRDASPAQLEALHMLARQVTRELQLRRRHAALQRPPAPAPACEPSQKTTAFGAPAGAPPDSLTIAGRYQLGEILGVGGMGIVVAATDLVRREEVAIKFLLPENRVNPARVEMFVHEARTLISVHCEHVARFLDASNLGNGAPYIVMERLVGRDLDALFDERGRLPIREAAGYLLQACAGVERIHAAGVVHRDLKPSNLFLVERPGDAPVIKVLDFGIACAADDDDDLAGTPQYMAPEQFVDGAVVDGRVDVWSLGVVLYEAIAGDRPFEGALPDIALRIQHDIPRQLRTIRRDVPPTLAAIVMRCLAKDPARRYPGVRELALDLAAFLEPPR